MNSISSSYELVIDSKIGQSLFMPDREPLRAIISEGSLKDISICATYNQTFIFGRELKLPIGERTLLLSILQHKEFPLSSLANRDDRKAALAARVAINEAVKEALRNLGIQNDLPLVIIAGGLLRISKPSLEKMKLEHNKQQKASERAFAELLGVYKETYVAPARTPPVVIAVQMTEAAEELTEKKSAHAASVFHPANVLIGKHPTLENRVSAVREYIDGAAVTEIARKYGVGRNVIYGWADKVEGSHAKRAAYFQLRKDNALREYIQGVPIVEIVSKHSVDQKNIFRWARKSEGACAKREESLRLKQDNAVQEYMQGVSVVEIARKYGANRNTINQWAKKIDGSKALREVSLQLQKTTASEIAIVARGELSPEKKLAAALEHIEGAPAVKVARRYGINRNTLRKWCVKVSECQANGVPLAEIAAALKGRDHSPEERRAAVQEYQEGVAVSAIAIKYGTSRNVVYGWAEKALGSPDRVSEQQRKKDAALEQLRNGIPPKQVAENVGLAYSTVWGYSVPNTERVKQPKDAPNRPPSIIRTTALLAQKLSRHKHS